MKKIIIGLVIVIIVVAAVIGVYLLGKKKKSPSQPSTQTTETNLSYIDTHAHRIGNDVGYEQIISAMDKYSIEKMIFMQTPVPANDTREKQTPESHSVPEAAEKYPDKFAVMYQDGAFILLSEAIEANSIDPAKEAEFIKLVTEAAQSKKYVGFGELVIRHFPQPNIKNEKERAGKDITIPGDHPWMLELADIAAEYNLPLDIHIEPNAETLPGFETLIAHNSKTKIIFDHAGWYNTGEGTPELFASLMGKYSNLYANIKLRNPASDEQAEVRILDEDGKIVPAWLEVFEKYPDRFMIGTDVKFGLTGGEADFETLLEYPQKLLKQLPADLASKIARENAETVFNFK